MNEKNVNENVQTQKKNLVLTFCWACCPGTGQMYQGFMKRGLSLLIIFGIMVMLATVFGPIIIVPVAILEAYSFFDTFRIRNLTKEELEKTEDELVWNTDAIKKCMPNTINIKKNKYIGVFLIIAGLYFATTIILGELSGWYKDLIYVQSFIEDYVPSILVAFAAIYFGVKMVKE